MQKMAESVGQWSKRVNENICTFFSNLGDESISEEVAVKVRDCMVRKSMIGWYIYQMECSEQRQPIVLRDIQHVLQ